jgi:hypothetical protein
MYILSKKCKNTDETMMLAKSLGLGVLFAVAAVFLLGLASL